MQVSSVFPTFCTHATYELPLMLPILNWTSLVHMGVITYALSRVPDKYICMVYSCDYHTMSFRLAMFLLFITIISN